MRTYGFPMMAEIVPEGKRNSLEITHFELTEEEVRYRSVMGSLRGDWTHNFNSPGTFCVLRETHSWGETWMSDTDFERYTTEAALREADGDVLLLGLGIGMLSLALCDKEDVNSITVIEKSQDVIDLVAPHVRHEKLRIIKGDAYIPPLATGRRFNYIWVDIWPTICSDNWPEMKGLLRLYRKLQVKGGQTTGWLKEYVQRLHKEGERW